MLAVQGNSSDLVSDRIAGFRQVELGYIGTQGLFLDVANETTRLDFSVPCSQEEVDMWIKHYQAWRKLKKTGALMGKIVCPKCGNIQRRIHALRASFN